MTRDHWARSSSRLAAALTVRRWRCRYAHRRALLPRLARFARSFDCGGCWRPFADQECRANWELCRRKQGRDARARLRLRCPLRRVGRNHPVPSDEDGQTTRARFSAWPDTRRYWSGSSAVSPEPQRLCWAHSGARICDLEVLTQQRW